ncbi:MAG: hypothetical protein AAGF73_01545 [Actinomycetota bacterium]
MEPTRPAVVLGSSQSSDVVDHVAARNLDVDVVRRRSGGGAVLVDPHTTAWFDVIVPAGAPGWGADIHRPMRWLGERLAHALRVVDRDLDPQLQVDVVETEWSRLVCFDGLGAGELTLGGHKLVGMSQRRTRAFARLQCSWYRRDERERLIELLAPAHRPPLAALAPHATLPHVELDDVLAALLPQLV